MEVGMKDDQFVARVRKHRPSALIPQVARLASQNMNPADWLRPGRRGFATPWALGEITRVSIAYSNEHRGDATIRDVLLCNDAYNELDDPELGDPAAPVAGFFLRMSEQLVYQEPLLNELARTTAVLAQTTPKRPPKVLSPGWDEDLFGVTLDEFMAAGQLLHMACKPNEGRFNPDWLRLPSFDFVRDRVDVDRLISVWERHFVISRNEFTVANGRPRSSLWRRFSFNPLLARPAVSGLLHSDDWLIPVPGFLARRISTGGVYYDGIQHFGKAFSDDLGDLFEQYVARQLALIPGAQIEEEIVHGKEDARTVDFVVTLPEVVLLVEVKSVRPTEPVRAGTPEAGAELQRMLTKGVRQLARDHKRIAEDHPAFAFVPRDRPRLGLLITMEDFHVVNSGFHRNLYQDSVETNLPVGVVSARDLEGLVTLTDVTVGSFLRSLEGETDRDPSAGFNVRYGLPGHTHRRNSVIDKAWNDGVWNQLLEEAREARAEDTLDGSG
jgi:hypothetical protein